MQSNDAISEILQVFVTFMTSLFLPVLDIFLDITDSESVINQAITTLFGFEQIRTVVFLGILFAPVLTMMWFLKNSHSRNDGGMQ